MTKERLQLFSYEELCNIAKQGDILFTPKDNKDRLISSIVDRFKQDQDERNSLLNYALQIEARKYSVSMDDEIDLYFDDYHEFPERYNKDTLVLLLRDPSWAYVFWDLSINRYQEAVAIPGFSSFILRVLELSGPVFESENIMDFYDIPVGFEDLDQYINLNSEDSWFCVELRVHGDEEAFLLRSNILTNSRSSLVRDLDTEPRLKTLFKLSGFSDGLQEFPLGEMSDSIPQRITPINDIPEGDNL